MRLPLCMGDQTLDKRRIKYNLNIEQATARQYIRISVEFVRELGRDHLLVVPVLDREEGRVVRSKEVPVVGVRRNDVRVDELRPR